MKKRKNTKNITKNNLQTKRNKNEKRKVKINKQRERKVFSSYAFDPDP